MPPIPPHPARSPRAMPAPLRTTLAICLAAALSGGCSLNRADRAAESPRLTFTNESTIPVRIWLGVAEFSPLSSAPLGVPRADTNLLVDGPWTINPGETLSAPLDAYPEYTAMVQAANGDPTTIECWWVELPDSTGDLAGIYGITALVQRGGWLDATFATSLAGNDQTLHLYAGPFGTLSLGKPPVELPKAPRSQPDISPAHTPGPPSTDPSRP